VHGLRAIVLGSAAGGGVPQWNCACQVCEMARAGDPRVQRRTQASVAVSADNDHWLLIGASPDLRQQLLQTPALAPRDTRHSPIFGVMVLGAEIDAIAGLLTLRERHRFRLFAPDSVLDVLRENPIFDALDQATVTRESVRAGATVHCGFGLQFRLLSLPGKVPLYQEAHSSAAEPAWAYAALIESNGRRLLVAPSCAEVTAAVRDMVGDSDVALFDGTLFSDDEMVVAGISDKTGRRMGHVSITGPDGSLATLRDLRTRVVLLHINNTNRVLIDGSPERAMVEQAGFQVAWDGMEIFCD
jgi:pyrroloquinoline quinone biosynthesis protein B